jgi:hypothetical protein
MIQILTDLVRPHGMVLSVNAAFVSFRSVKLLVCLGHPSHRVVE